MSKLRESKKPIPQEWTRYHNKSTCHFTGSMGSFYFQPPRFEPFNILTENAIFFKQKNKKFQISPKTPQNCPRSHLKSYRNTTQHVRGKPTTVMKPIRLSLTKPTQDEFYISRILCIPRELQSISFQILFLINIPHALPISSFPHSGNELTVRTL